MGGEGYGGRVGGRQGPKLRADTIKHANMRPRTLQQQQQQQKQQKQQQTP